MYQYLLTGAALLACSVTDLKCRRVYKVVAAGYFLSALLGHLIEGTAMPAGLISGLFPGACCLLVSWLSREGLGYGDSILILCCGISLGVWPCLSALMIALCLSGLIAVLLLLSRRVSRRKEIPLVPFLFLGVVIQWAGGV